MTHREADENGNIDCDVCGKIIKVRDCIRYYDGHVYCSDDCSHNKEFHSHLLEEE